MPEGSRAEAPKRKVMPQRAQLLIRAALQHILSHHLATRPKVRHHDALPIILRIAHEVREPTRLQALKRIQQIQSLQAGRRFAVEVVAGHAVEALVAHQQMPRLAILAAIVALRFG